VTDNTPVVVSKSFWVSMDPYLSNLSPVEASMLLPLNETHYSEQGIPHLGRHYTLQRKLESEEGWCYFYS
jgi:hypothetical protein